MPLNIAADATPADTAAPEPDTVAVTVTLDPRYWLYLSQRAGMFGDTPEAHLYRILREFRAYHDRHRPDQQPAPLEPGAGAMTRRA